MQQAAQNSNTGRARGTRAVVGLVAILVGALATFVGATNASAVDAPPTQTVPLHNDGADVEADCPNDVGDFWHFVIAPNNDTYSFVSITLSLDGATTTFSGGDIIPNGTQTDNIFIALPAGIDFDDLALPGSSAEITPATGSPKFVLSHLCDGAGTTTTTTIADSTTTTIADSTTTTTTTIADSTTTTIADETTTTTTVADDTTTTTTTVADDTTTTTEVDQGGPTTTVADSTTTEPDVDQGGPTTTAAGSAGGGPTTVAPQLPATGVDSTQTMVLLGTGLMLLGLTLLLGSRRPQQI
ncbi:MAG: hypothetical protein CL424_10775 [Acidimicrobiaceae bacterium]|nr:hypothetical protein [Acidimicrobiaceae bacterium]